MRFCSYMNASRSTLSRIKNVFIGATSFVALLTASIISVQTSFYAVHQVSHINHTVTNNANAASLNETEGPCAFCMTLGGPTSHKVISQDVPPPDAITLLLINEVPKKISIPPRFSQLYRGPPVLS